MKLISFEVAKAIREAGYPQKGLWYYSPDGRIGEVIPDDVDFAAPTYIEVWLWLWREKKTKISCQPWYDGLDKWGSTIETSFCYDEMYDYTDPEEAIIAAIKYLVDKDLIIK